MSKDGVISRLMRNDSYISWFRGRTRLRKNKRLVGLLKNALLREGNNVLHGSFGPEICVGLSMGQFVRERSKTTGKKKWLFVDHAMYGNQSLEIISMVLKPIQTWKQALSLDLMTLLHEAQKLSWQVHGKRLQCFIPGQMVYLDDRGKYPAISLTGSSCMLRCDHCYGKILDGMIPITEPRDLKKICREF